MVKLRAFIFGSVMHLYWGYTDTRNYASVYNIKIVNFLRFSHFALFSSCTMCFEIHITVNYFSEIIVMAILGCLLPECLQALL